MSGALLPLLRLPCTSAADGVVLQVKLDPIHRGGSAAPLGIGADLDQGGKRNPSTGGFGAVTAPTTRPADR